MGLRDCLIKTAYSKIPDTDITIFRNGNTFPELSTFLNKDNEKCVMTHFWKPVEEYTIAKLILLSFKPVNIPYQKWNLLYPDYIDGDKNNIDPSNLIWKFSERIESKLHPGFYHIPGFTRSLISLDGRCINTYRNTILSTDLVDGYLTVRVYSDSKRERTRTSIHRLLCLVFKGYPVNVDDLEVNHIDGNKLNNSLDNLEWVTHIRNIQHAKETNLLTCNIPFLTRNVITNEIREYYSANDFSKEHNVPSGVVSRRLQYENQPVFTDNLQYKRKDDPSPWREVVNLNIENRRAGFVRPILVKNIFTNEVFKFDNATIAEKELGLNRTTLLFHHAIKKDTPFKSFVFKDINDNKSWPIFNNELMELFKLNIKLERSHNVRIYKRTNIESKEISYFNSFIEATKEKYSLSKCTVVKTDIQKETKYE